MRNRWCSRLPWGLALGMAVIAAPMPARSADFTVDSTADALDALPGDGTCATGTGACTLRAAIQETNALPGADTIMLPAGTYLLTLGHSDLDSSGDLDVRDTLAIQGAGAATTIIDANHASRVIQVADTPGLPLALRGVTVQNGNGFAVSGEDFGSGISAFVGPVRHRACGRWRACAPCSRRRVPGGRRTGPGRSGQA